MLININIKLFVNEICDNTLKYPSFSLGLYFGTDK